MYLRIVHAGEFKRISLTKSFSTELDIGLKTSKRLMEKIVDNGRTYIRLDRFKDIDAYMNDVIKYQVFVAIVSTNDIEKRPSQL